MIKAKTRDVVEYKSVFRFNLFGYVDEEAAATMINTFWEYDKEDPDAMWELCLNTEGGDMEAGTAIFSELASHSLRGGGTHHVVTRVRGQAASCGSLIMQAGDHRTAGRMDYIMLHEPLMTFSDANMRRVMDELSQAQSWTENFLDVIMERATESREFFAQRICGRDWYVSGSEALRLGLIDEVA